MGEPIGIEEIMMVLAVASLIVGIIAVVIKLR